MTVTDFFRRKPEAAAAPAPDLSLVIDKLRAQLTQRASELLASRGEAQASAQRAAALQAALDEAQRSGREVVEMGSRLAKEREAFLQAELARRDGEVARLQEALALASERVMEVQRESEAALRARAAQLTALRSRMDDITDKFNDDLVELKRRMDVKLHLLNSEVDEGGGLAGHTEDRLRCLRPRLQPRRAAARGRGRAAGAGAALLPHRLPPASASCTLAWSRCWRTCAAACAGRT